MKKNLYIAFIVLLFINCSNVATAVKETFLDYVQTFPNSELSIEFAAINGGVFTMGNADYNQEVEVSSFWMARHETTWELYDLYLLRELDDTDFVGKASEVELAVDAVSSATTPYIDMSNGMGKGEGMPITNVTQYAAAQFCKWLSAKTGHFYRLPTEAEWEYASRAGSTKTYSFGDDVEQLDDFAWYAGNSEESYHEVGTKKPNKFGLFDMHGNLAEWTLDAYVDQPVYGAKNDPYLTAEELYPRVVKGGSWQDEAENVTSFSRVASQSKWKEIDPQVPKSLYWHTNAPFIGFRIVRPLQTPSKEEMESYWLQEIEEY